MNCEGRAGSADDGNIVRIGAQSSAVIQRRATVLIADSPLFERNESLRIRRPDVVRARTD